jgi:uncharacterized DUF497 family protein
MSYEWDSAKAQANLRRHGFDFADAALVLEDDHAITAADEASTSEERCTTLGMDSLGRVLVVVYTWRADNVRLISARKATRRE